MDFKIYEVHGTPYQDNGYYVNFKETQIIQECIFSRPESQHYTIFAILCSICLVENQTFKKWAFNYLSGKDRTGETAFQINNQLIEGMKNNPEDYISCCFPTLACIMLDPKYFAGNAAHRAYFDGIDRKTPLDLEKLALIATQTSPEQIHDMLWEAYRENQSQA